MGRSLTEALPQEHIRYRLTSLQRVLPGLPNAVIFMVFQTVVGRPISELLVGGLVVLVVGPLLALIVFSFFGVTLTPSAAVVRNWRRRIVLWRDVQAIHIESSQGKRTVVIYEANGRRTRLPAPVTGFLSWDRGFEEKFHTIGKWWLDHRGPDWIPVPPPRAWWDGRSTPTEAPLTPGS